uniref:Uncharacterized protein n=1 Tax=Rhodococcus sp. NS1 TaxID=402236 RepID=A0A097SPR6_9NOCA|nr:hypothetical protein LRS1606.83 [Rhodococcus sp. NS1]
MRGPSGLVTPRREKKRGLPTNTYGLSPLALHPGTYDPRSSQRQGPIRGDGATVAQSWTSTPGEGPRIRGARGPAAATLQRRRSVTVCAGAAAS